MTSGYGRNARLSRAALVTVAGASFVGISQQPDLALGSGAKAALALGGLVIAAGLVMAVRTLTSRGDSDDER